MKDTDEYRFVIDAYSPDTLPMVRLAEYMADLARLFGKAEQVRFVRIEAGSTVLVQGIEPEAASEVRNRIRGVADNQAPEDAIKAFRALDRRLAEDAATGSLLDTEGAVVVQFPGRDRLLPLTFGAFNQPGVLDGELIRVGGRDETVPIHLRDGATIHLCSADRDLARQLAIHLCGPVLRVYGEGRWERGSDGTWLMRRFNIENFKKLDDAPLGEVVERLRGVKGSGWREFDAPWTELRRLRGFDAVC